MSPLRFRLVLIFAGLLILGTAGFGTEAAYRSRVRSEFKSLERLVLSSHPGVLNRGVEFIRFGDDLGSLEPSLKDDAIAWLLRSFRMESALDRWKPGDPKVHAYYLVSFNLGELSGPDYCCHAFIWSPRERRFIHYLNWDLSDVRPVPGCPWPRDPPRPVRSQ